MPISAVSVFYVFSAVFRSFIYLRSFVHFDPCISFICLFTLARLCVYVLLVQFIYLFVHSSVPTSRGEKRRKRKFISIFRKSIFPSFLTSLFLALFRELLLHIHTTCRAINVAIFRASLPLHKGIIPYSCPLVLVSPPVFYFHFETTKVMVANLDIYDVHRTVAFHWTRHHEKWVKISYAYENRRKMWVLRLHRIVCSRWIVKMISLKIFL